MGSGHKRYYHGHGGGKSDRSHRNSNGDRSSYQSTSSNKRRRLSYDDNRDRDVMQAPSTNDPGVADDGWTKVSYSKGREKRSKSPLADVSALSSADRRETSNSSLPRINYHLNLKFDIQIRDLQLLPLYVLADGIAPNWCAVAGKNDIRKVVVVMVPGLDAWALNRGKTLLREKRQIVTQERQNSHGPLDALFTNTIEVMAPGDPKLAKVHSPLQAMLLCPENDKSKKGARDRGFDSVATPITEFVHTPEELRDAEFPIHPAAFTSNPDADLEFSRRSRTGRMTSDGWVDTEVTVSNPHRYSNPTDWFTQDLTLYAIDCEMVQTSDEKLSLARVSVVDHHNKVVLDRYVKPSLPITNYFTQYSGITPEHLADVTTTLADVQQQLLELFTADTILLGHSLESDLNALRLTHPFIVDTALLYPHARGLPLRNALKYLASRYLKREIQTAGAKGHDSVEDARAVLDLVRLKCEKGPRWGTLEANGEPMFKRVGNAGRTSAIVEYGTPERGLGKDATYHIGCQDDNEIVAGVIRAVKGDPSADIGADSQTDAKSNIAGPIPKGGAHFVWARLRALEILRGWASGSAGKSPIKGETGGLDTHQHVNNDQACDDAILSTIANISEIHTSLPSHTLLLVFSGTSDVRPVLKLQAQQQQYRREFKTKKWDEVSVQWTDREEQALRKACNEARKGWAVAAVT